MSQKRGYEALVSMTLFVVLNFQKCCGFNDCYWLSSLEKICFMFDESQRTFEESKQYCQIKGGFLLEIHDNEIQNFVETFLKSKTTFVGEAWLNLVRTNSNQWVWGGEQSGNYLTYSNWEIKNPSSDGINRAFMISTYTWVNTYNRTKASTICIKETTKTPESTSLSRAASIGIGVGVGLGGLVLIIVSSLLIAKFVFHKEIPLPFKSSRNRNSPGNGVNNGGNQISRYAEVVRPDPPHLPINSPPSMGFMYMSQPNSGEGLDGYPRADDAPPQPWSFGNDVYDNVNQST